LRPDLLLFLGHLHPLVVHLPIGGLVLLGILELMAGLTGRKEAAQNSLWILGFASGTTIISAWCGWMLGKSGGYEPQLLKWHQAAGLSVAAVVLVTLILRHLEWRRTYHTCLGVALVLLIVASDLGGSITHGRNFLFRYAPTCVRALLGSSSTMASTVKTTYPSIEQRVFTSIVEPILRERCVSCHGAERHKAELRLDTLDGLLRGGQNGPVIKADGAIDSPLVQCMLSPLDADGHMPPEEQPQPTAEEISLIKWWINQESNLTANLR
jgi:uncharacterized membrane protein